jgi:hypothetical protein
MGIIAGEGGIPGDHVGKIDLQESHALVEVADGDAASVIARVNGSMIKGRRLVVRGERDKEDRDRAAAGPRGRPERSGGGDRPRSDRPRSDRPRSDRPRSDGPRGDRPPRRPGSSDRPTRGGPPRRDRDRS